MKKWLSRIARSRTMLVFIALDIIGVVQANADFLSTVMTPAQFGWVLVGIGVTGKILRTVTDTPLKDK